MTITVNQTGALRLLVLVAAFGLTLLSADPALAACTPPLAAFDTNIVVTCVGPETNPVGDG